LCRVCYSPVFTYRIETQQHFNKGTMKLKILFTYFSILFFTYTYSQQSFITGKVTDAATGHALSRASIFIHGANTGATTDENGVYKTAAVSPGRYLVEVSFSGYETAIRTIHINGKTETDFSLGHSVVEQEAVTVTGVSSATRLKQLPQPVTIIKKENLLKTSSPNVISSITHIPGVTAVTTGPAIAKPFIRGLGYNRVVTINDGVRQEGQQWGDEHGIEIDDYNVQRIDVLKGPASLMYGSDALAGVINIQSLVPAPEGMVKVIALSEYQSNSNLRGFYGNIAGTKNGFGFNVYGSYKGASDYKNSYDGFVFNSKFNNQNIGGMLSYRGIWGHSFLNITHFNQQAGIVEGNRDDITGEFIKPVPGGNEEIVNHEDFKKIDPQIPFQHIRHFKIASDNSFSIGGGKLDALIGYQRNQRQEFGDPDDPSTPQAWFDLQTLNYAFKFNLSYKKDLKTSFGVTGMFQENKNKADEAIIPDHNLFDIGAFAFTQYNKGKLSLSGGLRFDNRHINSKEMLNGTDVKFTSFKKDFSNISGSAGLSYEASKEVTLKLNVARGFRAPTLAELASNGTHEGTNRYETGNHHLKSETSLQMDGGIEINGEHVSLTVNAFYNNIRNFIFYQKVLNSSGQDSILIDPDSGDPLNVFRYNSHDARLYGAEFNMDIHPHPLDWLHFENTFSVTRAQFNAEVDGSKNVPLIPAARYIGELRGNFLPNGRSLRNLYISFEADYTFKQNNPFTGFNTETATSGYLLLNASAGTEVTSKGKTIFSIHLTGMNLGNVAYQNHLSRLKYTAINNATGRRGVFNVGRNVGIKLNVPLDFKWS
jgi:iron complex outermembrane receptor protein